MRKSILGLLLLVATAFAQTTGTATLVGTVTDNTGAILPGATITATNTGTNASRVDVTNEKGAYTIPALPVGNYRVQVFGASVDERPHHLGHGAASQAVVVLDGERAGPGDQLVPEGAHR